MTRLIRLGVAAALVAAAAAPIAAQATGGCFPHFKEQHLVVGDKDVTYYTYDQMVC